VADLDLRGFKHKAHKHSP